MMKDKNKGFSLMEILLVVAILGILSAIAIPNYMRVKYKAQVASTIAELNTIVKAIYIYQSNQGSFPDALDELDIRDITDPWGRPYQYLNFKNVTGKGQMRKDRFMVPINSDFDLYSMGRDGKTVTPLTAEASRDDIIYANDGGFIGLAEDY
jgi:general secretion pathway protein G